MSQRVSTENLPYPHPFPIIPAIPEHMKMRPVFAHYVAAIITYPEGIKGFVRATAE
jgi:hypothetical protein